MKRLEHRLDNGFVSPLTGFGDTTQVSAKFGILHPDQMFPQWTSAASVSQHKIHNSNKTVIQYHGRELAMVSLRLWFSSIEQLMRLDDLVGQTSTLRYRAGLGKTVGGYRKAEGGVDYLVLENTTLLSLSDEQYEIDGACEATAVFAREYTSRSTVLPSTYPDLISPFTLPIAFSLPLMGSLVGKNESGGTFTSVGSGATRWVDGPTPHPDGDPTTNLLTNPSFEPGLTGWAPTGTIVNTQSTTYAYAGTSSLKSTCNTVSGFGGALNTTIVGSPVGGGVTYTFSAWLYADSSIVGLTAKIQANMIGGLATLGVAQTDYTIVAGWQRLVQTFTIDQVDRTSVQLFLRVNYTAVGQVAYWDAAQLEYGSVATTYCDGSLGSGYSWLGTAHASRSRRSASLDVALRTEESATNLMTNPIFGTGTAGWAGINCTLNWDQFWSYGDSPGSLQAVATSGTAIAYQSITLTVANQCLSAVVRNTSTGPRNFALRYDGVVATTSVINNIDGSFPTGITYATPYVVVPAGATVRLSAVVTGTGVGASVAVVCSNSVAGDTYNIGHYQAETRSYATTPVPEVDTAGTVKTGYTWSGTAHATTSTRATGSVSTTGTTHGWTVPKAQGEVIFRARWPYQRPTSGSVSRAGYFTALNGAVGVGTNTTGTFGSYTTFSSGSVNVNYAATSRIMDWVTIGASWVGRDLTLWVNGIARNTQTSVFDINALSASFFLASSVGAVDVEAAAVFSRVLNDAERTYVITKYL